jgi:hypothetical protein
LTVPVFQFYREQIVFTPWQPPHQRQSWTCLSRNVMSRRVSLSRSVLLPGCELEAVFLPALSDSIFRCVPSLTLTWRLPDIAVSLWSRSSFGNQPVPNAAALWIGNQIETPNGWW